ncbi:MAG: hypothetical protein E6H96_00965 [Chloroflexi bacterium]|nr:MAG: hypothetical protein E6H96_00965 [Chloroflexota bacterium]
MPEPIVFISHFRSKEGKLDAFRRWFEEGSKGLEAQKPRTLVFLGYLEEGGSRATIVHVFGDAESMDLHVQGADARSREAYDYLEPDGTEIYGWPSPSVMSVFRQEAASAGSLTLEPDYLGGFLRVSPG